MKNFCSLIDKFDESFVQLLQVFSKTDDFIEFFRKFVFASFQCEKHDKLPANLQLSSDQIDQFKK